MKNWSFQTWVIIIETIVIVGLVFAIFLRKRTLVKDIIAWIRPSAEGENKTASGRRLIAFSVTNICYIGGNFAFWDYAFTRPADHLIDPWVFIAKFFVDVVFVGLLWGFINQQTLVALKNGGGAGFIKTKEENTTTTSKETVIPASETEEKE